MSEKIYAWLLRLYPAAFRKDYGESMRQLFRDRMTAERSGAGRLRLWAEILFDCAVSLPREYFRPRGKMPYRPPAGYCLSEEALAKMPRHQLRPLSLLNVQILVGALAGVLGAVVGSRRLLIYGAGVLIALTATLSVIASRRARNRWREFELTIEGDRIVEKRRGEVALVLMKTEVARLLETPGLGLAILTASPGRSIWAPAGLSGYGELRDRLSEWAVLERNQVSRPPKRTGLLAFFWPLFAAALLVRPPYLFAPLGLITGAATLLMFAAARRVAAPRKPSLGELAFPLVMLALLAAKAVLVFG